MKAAARVSGPALPVPQADRVGGPVSASGWLGDSLAAGDPVGDDVLDLLSTAVLIIDASGCVALANQAAEQLLDTSRRNLLGQSGQRLFANAAAFDELLREAGVGELGLRRQVLEVLRPHREPLQVQVAASAVYRAATPLLLELTEVEQQLKVDRDERQHDLSEANRQMLRNLAHEVKNPLGGIRGAAQLLERELAAPEQREFTRVIMAEVDRLQALVDRLLAPHRQPRVIAQFNIHEVCERVRAVILAEFPQGLQVVRDYDASAPELRGDMEQLIQALLNIARNAAQALQGQIAAGTAQLTLRTRVARQVTIARERHRLALDLHVLDNGPGVPPELSERIFYPLVSGREGGSGLGLTLAQTLVQQHGGIIEFASRPGLTDFRILLPL